VGTIEPVWGPIEPVWGPIEPVWGPIEPVWGPIEPVWGPIEPVSGTVKSAWGPIEPVWGPIEPVWGPIEPVWGPIEPVWGPIEPVWGPIEPVAGINKSTWGPIEPVWGPIEPVAGSNKSAWGPIEPVWGTIAPVWGTIEPVWGKIAPLWGNIEPLMGSNQAQWGPIEPVWGPIEPVSGSNQSSWGPIEPVWGPIEPVWGPIEPVWGPIEPVWGPIEPVWGPIEPVWGPIEPVWGPIEPVWGPIEAVWGSIKPAVWSYIGPFAATLTPFSNIPNPYYGRVSPFWGDITPFWGDINPFWGPIEPVSGSNHQAWGPIEPVWGPIEPVWGDINPFWGTIEPVWGPIEPVWNQVGPYWTTTGIAWGNLNEAWAARQFINASDYTAVLQQLQLLVANAEAVWGPTVKAATHEDFEDFAAPIFAKYGISLTDAASLANVTGGQRSAFFLDWYDSLMGYSGMPRIDWWMGAVNWTPAITQIENSGTHAVVGILDSKFTDQGTNVKDLQFIGGYDYYVNDHGAAVASLIASQHTAGNVMGIAPNSPVLLYNPFDYTGTASWDDVAAGIQALYAHGASVVNISMGVPGQVLSDEWASILTNPQISKNPMVIVKAAGNEGTMQSSDINWIGNQAPNNLILVGSVGINGVISSFSNTPGNACILISGQCQEQNKLMYHFIVAPGENILVSNNAGGVMRASGTSFATPLVTGAVALLQDRWPWLKQHPDETVQIIFQSAKDLGAPGVDPVYGWGELDIEASQSPLDFNKLVVLQPGHGSAFGQMMSAGTLKASLLNPGQLALWQKKSAYLIAYETIGSTFRDFDIPLSSLLAGKKMANGQPDRPFQTYLYDRLIDWAHTPGAMGFNVSSGHVVKGDWSLSLTTTQSTPDEVRRDEGPVHYEFAAVNQKTGLGFAFGEGSGSHALTGMDGFSLRSDFDPATGGVNPVLGFASGGAYGRAQMTIGSARFSLGYTQKRDDHIIIDPTYGPVPEMNLSPNRAYASVMAVDYAVSDGIKLNASYTSLREADGLLGSQGAGIFNMVSGTRTAATTVGASFALPADWAVAASATTGRSTAPQFNGGAFSFSSDKLTSTAYEVVATRSGLFGEADTLRLSIAQPLHIESGAMQFQSMQVVDRQTGELGAYTQSWNVSGAREVRMEAMYGLPVLEGRGEVEGYALVDMNPQASLTGATELAIGWRARFGL
jgi:Subtilase family